MSDQFYNLSLSPCKLLFSSVLQTLLCQFRHHQQTCLENISFYLKNCYQIKINSQLNTDPFWTPCIFAPFWKSSFYIFLSISDIGNLPSDLRVLLIPACNFSHQLVDINVFLSEQNYAVHPTLSQRIRDIRPLPMKCKLVIISAPYHLRYTVI